MYCGRGKIRGANFRGSNSTAVLRKYFRGLENRESLTQRIFPRLCYDHRYDTQNVMPLSTPSYSIMKSQYNIC